MESRTVKIPICIMLSMLMALMPFSYSLDSVLDKKIAYANPAAFAGASAFLSEMAYTAGFASSSDLIATVVGVIAAGEGVNIARGAGVNYGNTAADNLSNLIAAADYPDWDTLSNNEKSSWGSQENYDSAKFNDLMNVFGMGTEYEAYKQGYTGTGGGHYTFGTTAQQTLNRLGNIGTNWINGVGNSITDIKSSITNTQYLNQWKVQNSLLVDTTNITNMPAGMPNPVEVVYSNRLNFYRNSDNLNNQWITTSRDVYWCLISQNTNSDSSFTLCEFDKQTFTYLDKNSDGTVNSSGNAVKKTINGQDFYMFNRGVTLTSQSIDMPINRKTQSVSINQDMVAYCLLFDSDMNGENLTPNLEGYNSEEPGTTLIVFPLGGMKPDTSFTQMVQEQQNTNENLDEIIALLNRFKFYSNGFLKVHDEGVYDAIGDVYNEIVDIKQLLEERLSTSGADEVIGDFDFDDISDRVPNLLEVLENVAPFGSLLLVSECVAILSQVDAVQSPSLEFEWKFGGSFVRNQNVNIDLSWMDDIKPVINFGFITLLIVGLCMASWRIVELEAAG